VTGRLAGKTALVSGAARGIGADIARLFAGQGASVLLTDIRDDEGRDVAAAITGTAAPPPTAAWTSGRARSGTRPATRPNGSSGRWTCW
jgi:NAD(P)-dependent dehydrogenase (short-subunit alcohol dehydrogenase family)